MLLGTSNPVDPLKEDMNLSPTIQFPASLDMDVLSMFPVAGLSDLNNADLSFLDNICIPGDNQHSGIDNMTDLNTVEGSSFNDLNGIPVDWLSGNSFDNLCEEESFLQSTNVDHVISPSISHSSYENCPAFTTESSCNTSEIHSLTDNSLLNEVQKPEERFYSSGEESGGNLTDVHCGTSPTSENVEMIHHNVDDYSAAGKKYLQMRKKNNIASQRSRKLRKQKNLKMVDRLKELECENVQLTKLAAELEKQRDALQRKLLQVISKK